MRTWDQNRKGTCEKGWGKFYGIPGDMERESGNEK